MIPISQSANKSTNDNTGVAVFVERNKKNDCTQHPVIITYKRKDVTHEKNKEKH